jgi:SAM-dependent methyltransferase
VLVDVGCGTGISSRLFAQRGIRVIGIEPNAEMRTQAEAAPTPPDSSAPEYRGGQAEATDLPDGAADAVLAAQAFHWFKVDEALREFHRILRPAGWVVLMWNERDESDPFTAEYGAAWRAAPDAAQIESARASVGYALFKHALFVAGERVVFKHAHSLSEEGMLGRVQSTSYVPRERTALDALTAALRAAFNRHQKDGRVVMHYETAVYVARRK